MRLTKETINAIKKMTKEGKSLRFISKKFGIGKTTVYYYFRKTKGKTYKLPEINFDSDKELGEVIGIFTGDGSQSFDPKNYHYLNRVHFGNHNKEYAYYVRNIYEKCFGKKFFITIDGPTKMVVATNSKDIFNFFHKYINFESSDKSNTVFVKKEYIKNRNFMIGFLKGLLDTDGSIYVGKYSKRIAFYTSSDKLAKQISVFLNLSGIKNSVSKSKKRNNCIYLFVDGHKKFLSMTEPFRARGLTE